MESRRMKLFISMVVKFGLGFLMIGLILFVCAGSLYYINGWIFIIALASPMMIFGIVLLIKDPETLARRLKSKESDRSQRKNIAAGGVMFIAAFVLSGLDYRFGWSKAPFAVTMSALAVMLIGYALFVAVILQNAYASRVVEVSDNQKIITTGLYAVVRHPMYVASILVFVSMPLVLGSYFALLPMLFYPVIIVRRIINEEELLMQELAGYKDYTEKVPYRLLPYIW